MNGGAFVVGFFFFCQTHFKSRILATDFTPTNHLEERLLDQA